MKPKWLEQLDEARLGKKRGFVLDGNAADKVFYPDAVRKAIPLKYFIAAYLAREGYSVGHYSLANGFEELRPPNATRTSASPFGSLPHDLQPDQALAHMTRWLRSPEPRVALILDYADHMAPTSGGLTSAMVGPVQMAMLEVLHSWGLDENIRRSSNLLFLISYENQVSNLLLQNGAGYQRLSIPLPNLEERLHFIRALSAEQELPEDGSERSALSTDELARVTSGLPYVEIEELLAYATARRRTLDHELIRERKAAVINQLCDGLLEVHEPSCGFEGVRGLSHAKEELGRVVRAIRTDPGTATQALLLVGVPGCGKSFLVGALAKELGYPCLAMRNVREGLVGASERNLERVLWVAETLSPCIIWMDELDQVMGQRNTGQSMDAGTSERMMARIWEFMGGMEHRGQILWVGTSNRPDVLDQAMLDRFQLVIPFLHPTRSEVEDLLPALAEQVGRTLSDDVRPHEIASLASLQSPTVRALQEVVARAGTLTDVDAGVARTPIDQAHLLEAAADYKPNYNRLQHQFIALNAVQMASFGSVLPWRCRVGRRLGTEIPEYLSGVVDPESGAVDDLMLNRRLAELAAALQHEQRSRQF